ncbi:hypothetical protein ABZS63_31805, partial [Streptomyces sp. NPDC005568]
MFMFLFLVVALAVVVAAVTLAVVGGGESGPLTDPAPERLEDPLPPHRPVNRADVDLLRFPVAVRGYRMADATAYRRGWGTPASAVPAAAVPCHK